MLGKRRVYAPKRAMSAPKRRKYDVPRMKMLKRNTYNRQQTTKAIMIYSDSATINPGIGTGTAQVYTANGIWDCDISGVGHQPAGFDQYTALFGEYVVTGSVIKVSYVNTSTTIPTIVGITLADQNTVKTDIREYIENGNTVWTTLGTFGSGTDIKTLTFEADISKFSTQSIYNEDDFAGSSSRNPTDSHFFHVWARAADQFSDPSALVINVEVKYDTTWRDPGITVLS